MIMIFYFVKYNDFHKYIASKFDIFIKKENPFSFFIFHSKQFHIFTLWMPWSMSRSGHYLKWKTKKIYKFGEFLSIFLGIFISNKLSFPQFNVCFYRWRSYVWSPITRATIISHSNFDQRLLFAVSFYTTYLLIIILTIIIY